MLKYACVLLLGTVLAEFVFQPVPAEEKIQPLPAEEQIQLVNDSSRVYTDVITNVGLQKHKFVYRRKGIIPESPRNSVILIGIDGLIRLYKHFIGAGGAFLENVVAELEALPKRSDAFKLRLATYRQALDSLHRSAEDYNDEVDIGALLDDSDAIISILFEYDNIPANSDLVALAKAFEKCGYAALEAAYNKEVLDFTERFMNTVDAYVATLDAQEKEKDRNLLSWYARYKAEEDLEKRILTFAELFYYFTEEDTIVKTEIDIHNLE